MRSKDSASPKGKKNVAKVRSARLIKEISVAAVAERQNILAQRVKQDRKERFESYMSKILPTGKGKPRTRRAALAMPAPLRILAEGDSWFEYPLEEGGIIDHLEGLLGVLICNMAHHGDEVRQMMGLSQRTELDERLSNPRIRFDALLFSGGGNDLVGDQFCIWLNEYHAGATPDELINRDRLAAVLSVVEAGYRDMIAIRDKRSPQTKIFFHGYDFPMPTGKKACFVGPWLKPSLEGRGIEDNQLQYEVVAVMLSEFAKMLQKVAVESTNVFYVPTQRNLEPTSTWWANEIHPSPKGFRKLAEVFKTALQVEFPELA